MLVLCIENVLNNLKKEFLETIDFIDFGALTRTRTANLLITNQLLYQLSYEGLNVYLK